jgi:hypothetical protein
MITAFVGTITDVIDTCIRGNGKTCSMTTIGYLSHLEGQKIYSNYTTDFSEEVLGLQAMIDKIKEESDRLKNEEIIESKFKNSMLLVSEMQKILNSIGSTNDEIIFIDNFCSEIRKHDLDLCYDTQRYKNIHLRLRTHTDNIFLPLKFHMDNTPCNFDRCKKDHKIYLYSYKPHFAKPRMIIDATVAGKMYNSNEIIYDILKIPKKNKRGGGDE